MVGTATVHYAPERLEVQRDVDWATYEALLTDYLDCSVPHFTYDRGVLEIMSPSTPHEEDNRTIAQVVEIVAEELSIDLINVGSTTYKRQELGRGFEPDSSFYIQNVTAVRGRDQIDLALDPPPDLVIEMEVSRTAIPKLPLFAAMGVPEVWRCDGERVIFLQLVGDDYHVTMNSLALPGLTSEAVTAFLGANRTMPRPAWTRSVRAWVRAHQTPTGDSAAV